MTFFRGLLHTDKWVLAGQQILTIISAVWIMNAVMRASRERWSIGTGGERELKNPCLMMMMLMIMIIKKWKCPWCNGCHRKKWIRRYEFKSWTRLIAFHIALIPLGIQLFSLQLWVNSTVDRVLQTWWGN